jgi:hypothetical protein
MKPQLRIKDPLNVLSSTKKVVESGELVKINQDKIPNLAKKIKDKIEAGLEGSSEHFGTPDNGFNSNAQLIFIEDSVNFCFWAEKGLEKFTVEWPKGNIVKGGWYGLKACFTRALAENTPVLDAEYLSKISLKDIKHLFRSANNSEIPLIKERHKILQETGRILIQKYNGKFITLVEESKKDAPTLAKKIYENFPSFRDIQKLDGEEVYFLKRAQITASDISMLFSQSGKAGLKNTDKLTAFADYKLPQMLRAFGVVTYATILAKKIDNYVLIPKGSRDEIEIRAATVWGIELIRQELKGKYPAAKIDFALWLLSQYQPKSIKPYHRTYTIFY